MNIERRQTRIIKIGGRFIGGNYPVLVQSMTKTDTRNVRETVEQIKELEKAGCDIVRVAVPDATAAEGLSEIKKQISIPLVADIHFNWELALKAIEQGADKIRIGFKVIGSEYKTKKILKAAKERGIPIRIGVNAGSLDSDIRLKYGNGVEAMIESAMRYIRICEDNDFFNIVVSMKSSDALETVKAYEALSQKIDYPLHLGVTNAGTMLPATVASAIAIGSLLERGIGDTIRVSLTGSPIDEVKIGKEILKTLHLRKAGVRVVSCPTCGRLEMGEKKFAEIVKNIEEALGGITEERTVSVIGCAVNGPGEALKADLGVMIIDKEKAALFRGDEIIKRVALSQIEAAILEEISNLTTLP